jgi:hypothetical protein
MRRRIVRAIPYVIVGAIIAAFLPAILCNARTSMHLSEFDNAMIDGFGTEFKVLTYGPDSAKIYAYTTEGENGDERLGGIIKLKRENGFWEVRGWEPIWSSEGGPNRVVWQYWWHAVYFLF